MDCVDDDIVAIDGSEQDVGSDVDVMFGYDTSEPSSDDTDCMNTLLLDIAFVAPRPPLICFCILGDVSGLTSATR